MENIEITTKSMRKKLKSIFDAELEKLPEYIEAMQPTEKLQFLIKIMPFILPKVESVEYSNGEPLNFDLD